MSTDDVYNRYHVIDINLSVAVHIGCICIEINTDITKYIIY